MHVLETVDGVILGRGQNVLLIAEEELRLELEPAQIRLQKSEELTVSVTLKRNNSALDGCAQVIQQLTLLCASRIEKMHYKLSYLFRNSGKTIKI